MGQIRVAKSGGGRAGADLDPAGRIDRLGAKEGRNEDEEAAGRVPGGEGDPALVAREHATIEIPDGVAEDGDDALVLKQTDVAGPAEVEAEGAVAAVIDTDDAAEKGRFRRGVGRGRDREAGEAGGDRCGGST